MTTTGPDAGRPPVDAPRVEVRRSARRRRTVTAYRDRDAIVVLIPAQMSKSQERVYVDELVAKVLAREQRTRAPQGDGELMARAGELLQRYLVPAVGPVAPPVAVTWVANQQRRWGSCSLASRTIRLSDRVRPMPGWVLDYVLLHELVHLVEADHTTRFWSLVAAYPEAERARGYLDGWVDGRREVTPR